ncbi:nucleotidyltransferase domain-containing protein [Candidatus Gracilibacteria bacterium]|nr:nucleotidyltransferase domain-containing protein [Candidatus Gracilibacteria bacterium]
MTNEALLKKALFWANILGLAPGVKAIFLSGSVAQNRAKETSDIDFFLIAKDGQIWTARFFVFGILKFFWQMRTDDRHAGKICPNHFITDTHLQIREQDAYSANLFSHNIPLYDPCLLYKKFVQENEVWVHSFGEQFRPHPGFKTSPNPGWECKKISFFWRWIESCLQYAQMEKIKRNHDYRLPGAKIILDDHELRFHPRPKNKSFSKL